VFVRVRPPAMGHTIGIKYTYKRWKDENYAFGWWIENQNNEELWRINVPCDENTEEEMWFSVFVRDSSGQEAWDTNNGWNYTAHIDNIPVVSYDETHPAIQQHKAQMRNLLTQNQDMEESEDFIQEVWMNTNIMVDR